MWNVLESYIIRFNLGTTSKPKEHGDGRPFSCTSLVGLERTITIAFVGNQAPFGGRILKDFVKKINIRWHPPLWHYIFDDVDWA